VRCLCDDFRMRRIDVETSAEGFVRVTRIRP
jgi:hypothetical protein